MFNCLLISIRQASLHVGFVALILLHVLFLTYVDWPYCSAAKRMSSVAMTKNDCSAWDDLQWRRRLETFGENDASILQSGPNGEVDAIW